MKSFILITIACWLMTITYTNAQTQNWLWAKSAGGSSNNYGNSVSTDANGNVYVTGSFDSPTISFGNYTLTNVDHDDVFLVKYDALGNVLWAKSAGGNSWDEGKSVSTDANGNVYVTGYFRSPTITFGNYTLTNAGIEDMFLAKYDSLGNLLWAKSAGGSDDDGGNSVSTDANANVYVTGYFLSPTISFGNDSLTNAGNYDIFIAKYDSLGNFIWAKSAGGRFGDGGNSVSTDANSNVYVTGSFQSDTISFGNYTLTNAGGEDIFLAKYDASGNILWAKNAGGSNADIVQSVSTDANGNVYVTGNFTSDTITFGNYTLTNTNEGFSDIFLAKYDALGNILWAKSIGGRDEDGVYSVSTDANTNVYITGGFRSPTITFGNYILTNAGSWDMFLAKYDAQGNILWAKSAGGSDWDEGLSVTTDANGNLYVVGGFESTTITFGNYTLTNAGGGDMFLAKLNGTTDINQFTIHNSQFTISPNPAKDIVYIKHSSPAAVSIFMLTGQQVVEAKLTTANSIDISELNAGIYILHAVEGNKVWNRKLIVSKE